MVTLFRKLFIKDYKNLSNPDVRNAHGKLASGFGLFSNAILFVLKLVFGFIAKSVSIIADSINNMTDFANSSIALIGFKISNKPADKEHPFGHERVEYIAGLIVSMVVLALSGILLVESIRKIIDGSIALYTWSSVIILGIAVIMKIIQAYFYWAIYKVTNSLTLKATMVDSLTDSISTTLLLISAVLSLTIGKNWEFSLDGYMGVIVAIAIFYSGIKMVIETSGPLIGESVQVEDLKNVISEITSYKGVLGIHDLVAHKYGPTKIFITLHVEVDSRKSILESHDLVDSIEMDIKKKYNVELTIHMDPIDVSNPETIRLKTKVNEIIHGINKDLSMHDFRVVHGETHTNVLFDIVLPFEFKFSEKEMLDLINKLINKDETHKLFCVINFDRPYVH